MADISKIQVPGSATQYNIKDAQARRDIEDVKADLDVVQDDLTIVKQSVVEKTEVIIATPGSIYSNPLNTEYVWMLKTPIPQGAIPSLTVICGSSFGVMTVYFFVKNANGTYSVIDSVTFTTASGNNPIQFPDGIMTDNDVYIGFYSQDGGIKYNSNNANAKEYSRCPSGSVSSAQITMSGTYRMDFCMNLSYVTYQNYLDDLDERINNLENVQKDYVVVDATGNGDYTTVIDAIATEPENTVIIVKAGIYEQDMTACLKKRIILIGVDRNQCIIRNSDGRYGHHPLYISCGYFENLTIEAPFIDGESQTVGASDLGAYAVHIDTDEDYGIGKQCEFHHCTIKSDFFPAVGLGMRKNATYIFDNCELINGQIEGRGDYSDEGTLGALYFHDSSGEQGDQYISVTNCVLKSNLKYAMCPYMVNRSTQNNRVFCDFINNVLYSNVGKYTDTVWFRRNPFNPTTGIFKIGIGYGNSISTLNN